MCVAQAGDHVGVVLGAVAAFGDEDGGGKFEAARRRDAGGSATLERTMAISTSGRRPSRMDSAMARKLEPRPERRIPSRRGGRALCAPSFDAGSKLRIQSAFRPWLLSPRYLPSPDAVA